MAPLTQYARNGDVSIAYQQVGDGPLDLLFSLGFVSHLDLLWEEPGLARFLQRIARFSRLILFDRRGIGLSDPVVDGGPEAEIADLDAILDAAGVRRAALLGYSNGGPPCVRYAVARPERVSHLILYGAMVTTARDDEVDWTFTQPERERAFERQLAHWGEGRLLERSAPSATSDPRLRAWFARLERLSASPGVARATAMASEVDVRPLLERVAAPTLLLHRTGDPLMDVRHSRLMAERIPGARLVELPGRDSMPSVGDSARLVAEIEEFLTGRRALGGVERGLRTVLFTDICDATAQAARLGDARWRDLLAEHDAVIDRLLDRYGGWRVKGTGDGVLATFAGLPSDAVRCTRELVEELEALGLRPRAGLHTGECELIGGDVGGLAVHIAARVCALAGPGEVYVSGTVFGTAVGSDLPFRDLGPHRLKGVAERWPVFALVRES